MVFLEIIEWTDPKPDEIVHRIPEHGSADIKMGAQLIVRENQAAVFFRDGKGLDAFGPGRHTLSTANLPILTRALSLPFGFDSPFRCEVYFVNMKVFTDLKWGTKEPVAFRDSELGLVRLRAFGNYTMRVANPLLFINTLVGTRGIYTTEEINDYLRDVIVARLNDLLGENLDTIFNLPQNYDEIAAAMKSRLYEDFAKYGIELIDYFIQSITPPPEVQKVIDERSAMGAVGDMRTYMQFKAAKAMGDAAKAGGEAGEGVGGAAAAGMGVGVGAGLGMMVPGMIYQAFQQGQQGSPQAAPQAQQKCPECGQPVPQGARFCPNCGEPIMVGLVCPKCNTPQPPGANFCSNCGAKLQQKEEEVVCKKCGTKLPPGSKFCTNCGEKIS